MWIEDLTKAMYFLNTSDHKWTVCIKKIEKDMVYFTNCVQVPVQVLANGYDIYIKTGKIIDIGF